MATAGLSTGFGRIVAFGKESAFGTKPARNSGKELRRTAVDLQPAKDTITSNEIRSDYQRVEFRHGIRRVTGNINTELGLNTQSDFMASLLRRDFAATGATYTAGASDTITFAAGTATRSAGGSGDSFISDGFKVGHVVRISGSSAPTGTAGAFSGRNFRITGVTDTVLTSPDFDASSSALSSNVTIAVVGHTTFTPTSSHTTDSYTVEVYEQGLDKSIAYKGVRIGSAAIDIGPGSITTVNFGCIGQDFETIEESGGSSTDVPYFQSPAAPATGTLLAGPQGSLRIGGNDLAIVTQATINIDNNLTADPVIGALKVPDVFYSQQVVNGQFTLYTANLQMLKDFTDESELSFNIVMEEPVTTGAPGFFSIYIPRLKLSGFNIPDSQGPIIQTVQFEALRDVSATSAEVSTQIMFQDSSIS